MANLKNITDLPMAESAEGLNLTATDIGADAAGAAEDALTDAKLYTDIKIADIVNSAPETLDTLGELATAFQENEDVVDVLNQAITTKYSANNPPPYPVTSVDGKTGAVVLSSETWTFTLADGTTVTKNVVIK